jgi:glycosyltransferase involved in cell wall biosynthesis
MPDVSIVIATYNRPDALRAAIQSVYAQDYTSWQLLVIGDACDTRTAAVVNEFDARTRYINLPTSCGEQAIPNSVGMSLGHSPFIALLNHDDLWLADHLTLAITALKQGCELYHGRSAVAREVKRMADGETAPVFSRMSPIHLNYGHALHIEDFEPASALVFKRSLFERVGRWHAAREIYRFPFTDWLLRIWRARAKVEFGKEISVLKLETYWQARLENENSAGAYAQPCPEHAFVLKQMQQLGPDFRFAITQEIIARQSGAEPKISTLRASFDALAEHVFWITKIDLHVLHARLRSSAQRGEYLKHMSLRRTGRELPPLPNFDALLDFSQRQFRESEAARNQFESFGNKSTHAHAN